MFKYIYNFILCLRFPFIKVKHRFDGKFCGYGSTELDFLPQGWKKAFGIDICKDLKACFKKTKNKKFRYSIAQIKEKWGSLRWYDNGVPQDISKEYEEIIKKYEEISKNTCILCGKYAIIINNKGWFEPICNNCQKEMKKK